MGRPSSTSRGHVNPSEVRTRSIDPDVGFGFVMRDQINDVFRDAQLERLARLPLFVVRSFVPNDYAMLRYIDSTSGGFSRQLALCIYTTQERASVCMNEAPHVREVVEFEDWGLLMRFLESCWGGVPFAAFDVPPSDSTIEFFSLRLDQFFAFCDMQIHS